MTSDSHKHFPIDQVLLNTYRAVFENFGYAIRIAWAWILVVTTARIGSDLIAKTFLTSGTGEPAVSWNLTFLIGWLLFVPLASIAVAWHRLLLTGERDSSFIYLRLDRLVWRYFGLAVAIFVISLLPILGIWGLGEFAEQIAAMTGSASEGKTGVEVLLAPAGPAALPIIQAVATILIFWLTARLAVILPGKALNLPDMSLRRAWQVTRGHSWGLLMGMFGCIVPFLFLIGGVRGMGFKYSAVDGPFLHISEWLFVESMAALFSLVQISFFSFCFQFFFKRESGLKSTN